jgi:hypothetical protein
MSVHYTAGMNGKPVSPAAFSPGIGVAGAPLEPAAA